MAAKLKQESRLPGKLHVGDRVRFNIAGNRWEAVIIEDRGKLGVGGRRIWRVRTTNDSPGAEFETEMPEDELTRVA